MISLSSLIIKKFLGYTKSTATALFAKKYDLVSKLLGVVGLKAYTIVSLILKNSATGGVGTWYNLIMKILLAGICYPNLN